MILYSSGVELGGGGGSSAPLPLVIFPILRELRSPSHKQHIAKMTEHDNETCFHRKESCHKFKALATILPLLVHI